MEIEDLGKDVVEAHFYVRDSMVNSCVIANQKLTNIFGGDSSSIVKLFHKLPLLATIGWQMFRLYLL